MIRKSLCSIVLVCALAAFLAGTSLAQSEEPGSNSPPQAEVSPSSSESKTPRIPVLPPEVAKEVEGIEHQIDALLNRGKERSPEELQSLVRAAERAVALRTQHQGKTWWETIDAQQHILDLQRWISLTAEDRAAWAQSFSLARKATKLYRLGKYQEAQPLSQRALAIRETVLGPEHPGTAISLNTLAKLYQAQGQYSQAQPLYERALAIFERIRGPEHSDTVVSLDNLAGLYQAQEAYAQAQPLYERALEILERTRGPKHPDTAVSLNNLAMLYEALGQYTQAQPLFERALAITEKALGPEHSDTATSLVNLATLYEKQGAYTQALPLAQRALAIREQILGPNDPNTDTVLLILGGLYKAQGQHAQALQLYQRARANVEKTFGSDHPNMATMLQTLADLLLAAGQYAEAQSMSDRALAIREKSLGPNHPNTATSLHSLAELYMHQGQYAKAQALSERALAIRGKVLGPDHRNTAASLNSLALLYENQGQYARALQFTQRALAILEQTRGPEHPDTAASLNNLAVLYEAVGQYTQAQPLFERVLAINEKSLGPNHPDTATSLNNLAALYHSQGQYTKAQLLFEQALAIRERVWGLDHPDTASSLNNLALLYKDQHQDSKAQSLLEQALTISEKLLGPDHPRTATSLNNLAWLYQSQGQYAQALPLEQRALAILSKTRGPNHPDTAAALERLAVMQIGEPDEAVAQLFLRTSQAKWQYLTQTFPTLSTAVQQQFLSKSTLQTSPQYFWPLFTALPELDRAMGFQATLLSKQLVAEATRHESSALRQVLADAPSAWRTLWHQREDLRRQYATRALQDLQHDPARPRPLTQQQATNRTSVRDLSDQIDQLEQQLRRDHPAYANLAQLEQVSVDQVQAALRPQDLLLEYVQFRSYDLQANRLTDTQHYGVYVVRGDRSPIVALDLGEAAPIDKAIATIQAESLAFLSYVTGFTTEADAAPKKVRDSERVLAEAAATLYKLVWTPLESHLKGVKRVYVAPDGQLSLVPFEILPATTKQGGYRYLVEDRELVYLNTGRDLARLALTTTPPSSQPAEPPANPTAVLIGNPAFGATPREVAQVVAGLPPPLLVAQADAAPQGGTLGLASQEENTRRQVPREWEPFPQLDHLLSKAEVQLGQVGWEVTEFKNTAAVEEAVLRVQAPRILQLATHGYLLDPVGPDAQRQDHPLLRSMLLFSGVNQADPAQTVFYRVGQDLLSEPEAQQRGLSGEDLHQARITIGDGILTAYEVTGMNLQGTELVNLTACKTGLGKVTADGVIGLRQAFLLAGARALTLSLWEVPVTATTEQMEHFYARWLRTGIDKKNKKITKSQPALTRYAAFRASQLDALATVRASRYASGHPFFWAGTIYLGDPGDLPTPAHSLKQ